MRARQRTGTEVEGIEPKLEDNAETEDDKPLDVSSKGTDLDPLSIGGGLKSVDEMSSAVITEETENGILAAAKAPTPVSGYTGTKDCV